MFITRFKHDQALSREFVDLEYRLYRNDPHWVPPLRRGRLREVGSDNPLFQRTGHDRIHFLVHDGHHAVGRPVGRLVAAVSPDLRDEDGTPVGTVGMFECDESPAAASALLGAGVEWLREKHGIRRVWGPMNYDIWHGYRLMIRGFEERRFHGEPYNKPYYDAFFRSAGFEVAKSWKSVEVAGSDRLEVLHGRGKDRLRWTKAQGYRFRTFDTGRFREDLRELHGLVTGIFRGFLGYTDITYDAFERLFAPDPRALDPRLITFVHDPAGRVVAFLGSFPDLAEAVASMGGRSGPGARLRFALRRRTADRALVYLVGSNNEERRKRSGLGRALAAHLVEQMRNAGYSSFIAALMADGSPAFPLLAGQGGGSEREYVLYRLGS